jgi:hypothetical protein
LPAGSAGRDGAIVSRVTRTSQHESDFGCIPISFYLSMPRIIVAEWEREIKENQRSKIEDKRHREKMKNGRDDSSGMEDFDPIGAGGTYIFTQSRNENI